MKIAQLRQKHGWTQAELAKRCSTSQQQIAKIEKGVVDPKLSTLESLAESFECEVADLLFSKSEFVKAVASVAKKFKVDLKKVSTGHLSTLCSYEEKIPAFHSYWERIAIVDGEIQWKGSHK